MFLLIMESQNKTMQMNKIIAYIIMAVFIDFKLIPYIKSHDSIRDESDQNN